MQMTPVRTLAAMSETRRASCRKFRSCGAEVGLALERTTEGACAKMYSITRSPGGWRVCRVSSTHKLLSTRTHTAL